jgi:hypothetical protein
MNETQTAPPTVTPPKPAPKPVAADAGTEYLVLRKIDDGKGWATVNTATARTTEAAIKAVVEKLAEKDQAGTYVAVVASRWQPVEIEPKVERSLVVKAVK